MLGLGISLAKGAFANIVTYVRDNLKLFFNFKEHQDNPISHASTGSTSFDGTNDYVESGSNVGITGASAKSGCAWIYPTAVDDHAVIFDWGEASATKANQFKLFEESANTCKLRFDANGTNATGTTVFAVNTWYHVAFTYDGDKIRVYVNGSLEDTSSSITCNSTDSHLIIGNGQPSNSQWFTGSICNVGIWSRALSASEVQGIMYKQYSDLGSVDKTNLVSWWGLDVDYDDAHGSNDGTNSGSTLTNSVYGDNAPQIPRILDVAQPKQAVQLADGSTSFDGTDDYISLGTGLGTALGDNYSNQLTFSCWFNSANTNSDDGIFSIGAYTGSGEIDIDIEGNKIILYVDANSYRNKWVFTDANTWHHMAIIFDGGDASNNKLYLDGSVQTSDSVAGSYSSANLDLNGLESRIGQYSTGSMYEGKLANVSIHSSALTQSQVQELMFTEKYAGLSSGLKTNLVSWYDLGEAVESDNLILDQVNSSYSFGSELISNGGFDSDTSGWSVSNATLDSVSSGQSGNCLEVTRTGSDNQKAHQTVTVTAGKIYRITGYVKSGTSGNEEFKLQLLDGSTVTGVTTGTSSSSWVQYSVFGIALTTSMKLQLIKNTSTSGTMLFDTISYKEVTSGGNIGVVYGATTTTGYTSSPHGVVDPINYGTIKSGTAVSFDGTNDYVDSGSAFQSTFRDSFSISMWVNATDGQEAQYRVLFGARNADESDWVQGDLYNGTIRFVFKANTNSVISASSAVLSDGITGWKHIVFIADGVNMITYLDGSAIKTTSMSGVTMSEYTSADEIWIGARDQNDVAQLFFAGKISNIKIFNSALTESEIQEMYLNPEQILPTGVSSSNLKLYLPMNEGVGAYNYDGSGNQNHGTITGATWAKAETDIAQVGLVRQNKPMVFDGVDDCVTNSTDNVARDATYSWWSKSTKTTANTVFGHGGAAKAFHLNFSANKPLLYLAGAGFRYWVDNSAQDDGNWHHYALIVDVSDLASCKLYIDATEISTDTTNSTDPADSYGEGLTIGRQAAASGTAFDGIINEFAVWDTHLTASEITALYNSGTPLDATADSGNYASSGDLQGYWRNDNDTTWTDRSTNSNNGTASGSPASIVLTEGLTSGRDSQGFYLTDTTENCLTLNGAEYVEVPDSDVLSFGDGTDDRPFSIEAWVKADDITDFQIISKGVYNTDAEWRLLFGGGNQLTFSLYDESGSNTYEIAYTTSALTAHEGIWTHVCGTYNGVGGASANAGIVLYVNGVSQSLSYLTNGTYVAMENLGADVQIGLNNTEYSDGKIDDVRIYSKALSSDEITKNYNAGKSKHS